MKRFALLLALAAAACAPQPPASPTPAPADASLARWEALGLHSYRFDLERDCFCLPEATQPVTVTVRDGVVAEVRSRSSGAVLAPTGNLTWPTVGELLRQAADARAAGTETRVAFGPDGYPAEIQVGSLAADAGTHYVVANLVPLR